MAEVIRMPRMSDTMEVGVIVDWHKNVGDSVASGDLLAEVETDKATMELESYQEGVLLFQGVEKGGEVPVNAVLAILGEKGEDYKALLEEELAKDQATGSESGEVETAVEESKTATQEGSSVSTTVETLSQTQHTPPSPAEFPTPANDNGNGRLKASPLAKKLAAEKGIDLNGVQGSGPDGRIVKRDVEHLSNGQSAGSSAAATQQVHIDLPSFSGVENSKPVPNSQMRKTIARRLGESKFSSPHFYLTMEINMDRCIEARKSLNEKSPVKISFNDLIVKAAAASLKKHPGVNASWTNEAIHYHDHVHIGVAVAVDEGLVVPVIKFADGKSLTHISVETKQMASKAREKKIQPSEMEGNTFTISNLGMFGIDAFTAIINPPDACILAVGGINQVPVVKDGLVVPGSIMKVTLSCDHRIVDGAVGAAFLQDLRLMLEDPVRILL